MFVATLIAAERLSDETVVSARALLLAAGQRVAQTTVIDVGCATDLLFDGDLAIARAALLPLADSIDIVVQPIAGRRKELMIADMDSTMITVECIDELADFAGIKPQIAAITERAMRGELDFRAALAERVGLLRGLAESAIDQCLAERVTVMPGARTLVQTMKGHDARATLVSGGFTRFAEPVAAMIGFDRVVANVLTIENHVLTGAVAEPIVDSATKLDVLRGECATAGLALSAALAVGDGANDVPMLVAAGLGVAFHAHPAARAAAAASISHNDLTALLWAQGYPRARWIC